MRPPFPYYGGKSRLAPLLVSLLPAHRTYVEPYAGSGAVLFAKAPSVNEILNDIDGNVVTFFRVLRERPEDLQHVCELTPYARAEFESCDLRENGIDELERARRFFVKASQSVNANGTFPGRASWATTVRQGSSKATTARRRVDAFMAVAERLRAVAVESRPAVEVVGRFDSPTTVFYVDPPYLGSTRTSLSVESGRRRRDYAHDMTTEADHRELAAALHAVEGVVLLSGYASDLYAELYGDWARIAIDVQRSSSNRRGATSDIATEVIWSNRPIAQQLTVDDVLTAVPG